jgi:hypothetical protein
MRIAAARSANRFPDRACEYLKLEIIPKARFHRSATFAHECQYGLSAFDALHLTTASTGRL